MRSGGLCFPCLMPAGEIADLKVCASPYWRRVDDYFVTPAANFSPLAVRRKVACADRESAPGESRSVLDVGLFDHIRFAVAAEPASAPWPRRTYLRCRAETADPFLHPAPGRDFPRRWSRSPELPPP